MIEERFSNNGGDESLVVLKFHLIYNDRHPRYYQVKLRQDDYYASESRRYSRGVVDIDYLVNMDDYSLNKELFTMLYPNFDADIVQKMIREFVGKNYTEMYHGSQDDDFWKDPKSGIELMNMYPKYRAKYTMDDLEYLINL